MDGISLSNNIFADFLMQWSNDILHQCAESMFLQDPIPVVGRYNVHPKHGQSITASITVSAAILYWASLATAIGSTLTIRFAIESKLMS